MIVAPPFASRLTDLRLHLHHRLDYARFRLRVRREIADQFRERRPMRDPRPRVDLAVFDQLDDAVEVARQGVPRGKQRHFAPMKQRIGKRHFIDDDADEYQSAGVSDVVEGVAHRLRTACRIENDGIKGAVGLVLHRLQNRRVVAEADRVMNAHLLLAEVETLLVQIENGDCRARQLDEFNDGQTDRTGADDEDVFAGLGCRG